MPPRDISVGKFRDGTERFQDILLEILPELLRMPEYMAVPYKYLGLLNPNERGGDGFSSQFLVTKNQERSKLFTMFRNEQLAILTPYIKLYKVKTKKVPGSPAPVGTSEEEIIVLKTAYNVEDFDPHKASFTRDSDDVIDVGAGGVERITYVIRNERPSDQDINVTIDLAFDNLYSFLNSDLTELITFPFQQISTDKQHIEEKMLMIQLGWSRPQDPTKALLDEDEIGIIEGMKEVFDLYIVDHSISFNHDGSVRVSVVYQAARHGLMGRPSNNVFGFDRLSAFKEARGDIFERFESTRSIGVDKLYIFAETISVIARYLKLVEDEAIKVLEQTRGNTQSKGHGDVMRILNDGYDPNKSYRQAPANEMHRRLKRLLEGRIGINSTVQIRVDDEVRSIDAKNPIPDSVRRQAKQNQIQAILVVFLHDKIFSRDSTLQKEGLSAAIEDIAITLDATTKKLFMNYLFYGIRPHLGYVSVEAFSYTPSLTGDSTGARSSFSYDTNFAKEVYNTEEFFETMAKSMEDLRFKRKNVLWQGPPVVGTAEFDAKKFINGILGKTNAAIDGGVDPSLAGGPATVVIETGGDLTGPGTDDIIAASEELGTGTLKPEDMETWLEWFDKQGGDPGFANQYFPVFFTKLGDIIDCILTFDENVTGENILPVLGTARIRTRGGKVIESFNLADLPIEMDSFRSFLVNELIRPKRKSVTAQDLVNAVFENYVEPVIDFDKDNVNKDNLTSAMVPRRVIPRSRTFLGLKNNHKKFLKEEEAALFRSDGDTIKLEVGTARDILRDLGAEPEKYYMSSGAVSKDIGDQFSLSKRRRDNSNIKNYLLYYVDFYEFEKLDGKQSTNLARGIPHFRVGLDRGLLISADFAKVDDPKLRDARIAAVTSGASTFVLWNPYNVQLTLYGNNLLDKGQLFYIDGNYLGLDSYRKMDEIGIGGYYIAMDIRGEITTSEYITKVAGIWQYNPNVQGLRRLSVATEIGE